MDFRKIRKLCYNDVTVSLQEVSVSRWGSKRSFRVAACIERPPIDGVDINAMAERLLTPNQVLLAIDEDGEAAPLPDTGHVYPLRCEVTDRVGSNLLLITWWFYRLSDAAEAVFHGHFD